MSLITPPTLISATPDAQPIIGPGTITNWPSKTQHVWKLPTRPAAVHGLVTAVATVSPDITIVAVVVVVVIGIVDGDVAKVIPANGHRGLGLCRRGELRPFDRPKRGSASVLPHLHHGPLGQKEGLEGCRFRVLRNDQFVDGCIELCVRDDVVYNLVSPLHIYPGPRQVESLCVRQLTLPGARFEIASVAVRISIFVQIADAQAGVGEEGPKRGARFGSCRNGRFLAPLVRVGVVS